jgi:hypothetical protein
MRQQKTASDEAVKQLANEIRARRRQVQDALEFSLQPGRYERPAGSRLMQVFASYRGIDDEPGSAR